MRRSVGRIKIPGVKKKSVKNLGALKTLGGVKCLGIMGKRKEKIG